MSEMKINPTIVSQNLRIMESLAAQAEGLSTPTLEASCSGASADAVRELGSAVSDLSAKLAASIRATENYISLATNVMCDVDAEVASDIASGSGVEVGASASESGSSSKSSSTSRHRAHSR